MSEGGDLTTMPVGSEDAETVSTDVAVEILEERQKQRELTLRDAVSGEFDIVSVKHDPVNGSYVILADRPTFTSESFREMGYSSPSPWTAWTREERVPELREKRGIRTYYDMKRADSTVRTSLRILKTPILGAEWFMKPASESRIDLNIAKFVESNFFDKLNVAWSRVIEDILLMCEYGYMPMEKVWGYDPTDPSKIILRKLGSRHPLDIREWLYDDFGGPSYLVMESSEASGWQEVIIPINKLAVFVFEQEGGDLRGTSALRSAYKHYYYKDNLYKIDAIQKERHGIGVPIIKLPMGFTAEDRRLAEELGRNLRTNERAHITAPMNWEICFAKLEGQPVDCLTSIKHHDLKIMSNVLAPFADDPGVKPDSLDLFYKSTRYIAATICAVFNKHVIPELVHMNFLRGNLPKLMVRRIGEWEDLRTMTFALRNLVGAKLLTPDDPTEELIRDWVFLPPMDPESSRELVTPTPQATPVAAPRPSPANMPRAQNVPPVGLPSPNAGKDRSGG